MRGRGRKRSLSPSSLTAAAPTASRGSSRSRYRSPSPLNRLAETVEKMVASKTGKRSHSPRMDREREAWGVGHTATVHESHEPGRSAMTSYDYGFDSTLRADRGVTDMLLRTGGGGGDLAGAPKGAAGAQQEGCGLVQPGEFKAVVLTEKEIEQIVSEELQKNGAMLAKERRTEERRGEYLVARLDEYYGRVAEYQAQEQRRGERARHAEHERQLRTMQQASERSARAELVRQELESKKAQEAEHWRIEDEWRKKKEKEYEQLKEGQERRRLEQTMHTALHRNAVKSLQHEIEDNLRNYLIKCIISPKEALAHAQQMGDAELEKRARRAILQKAAEEKNEVRREVIRLLKFQRDEEALRRISAGRGGRHTLETQQGRLRPGPTYGSIEAVGGTKKGGSGGGRGGGNGSLSHSILLAAARAGGTGGAGLGAAGEAAAAAAAAAVGDTAAGATSRGRRGRRGARGRRGSSTSGGGDNSSTKRPLLLTNEQLHWAKREVDAVTSPGPGQYDLRHFAEQEDPTGRVWVGGRR